MAEDAASARPGESRLLLRTRVLLWVQLACGLAGLAGVCAPAVLGVSGFFALLMSIGPLLALATSVVPMVALHRAGSRAWFVAVLSLLVLPVLCVLGSVAGPVHFSFATVGDGVWRVTLATRLVTVGGWFVLLAALVALLDVVLLCLPSSRAAFASR